MSPKPGKHLVLHLSSQGPKCYTGSIPSSTEERIHTYHPGNLPFLTWLPLLGGGIEHLMDGPRCRHRNTFVGKKFLLFDSGVK